MNDQFSAHYQTATSAGIVKSSKLALKLMQAYSGGGVWIHEDGRCIVANGKVMKALPKRVFDLLLKKELIVKQRCDYYNKHVAIYNPRWW